MKIKKITDLDKGLARIAELDSAISQIDNAATEAINKAKSDAEAQSQDLIQERDKIIEAMKEFSDEHREEIYEEGKKSRDFVNGTIGYRKSADKVEVSEETAQLLCDAGFTHCVKIKKEPVKAALKNFDKDQLQKFKVKVLPGEESFYAKAADKTIPDSAA